MLSSLSSFRGAAQACAIVSAQVSLMVPSYSSIRQWFLRVGLYALNQAPVYRDDWIYVTDITLEVGPQKCLVVLGLPQRHWQPLVQKRSGHLRYADMMLYEGTNTVQDLTILNPYQAPRIRGVKDTYLDTYLDVKAQLNNGTTVIIEMQILNLEGFERCLIAKLSIAVRKRLNHGEYR